MWPLSVMWALPVFLHDSLCVLFLQFLLYCFLALYHMTIYGVFIQKFCLYASHVAFMEIDF